MENFISVKSIHFLVGVKYLLMLREIQAGVWMNAWDRVQQK